MTYSPVRSVSQMSRWRMADGAASSSGQTSPWRTAWVAAAVRDSTPSRPRMAATCLEAVRGLMASRPAIARSEQPSTMRRSTSRSRVVNSAVPRSPPRRAPWPARPAPRRRPAPGAAPARPPRPRRTRLAEGRRAAATVRPYAARADGTTGALPISRWAAAPRAARRRIRLAAGARDAAQAVEDDADVVLIADGRERPRLPKAAPAARGRRRPATTRPGGQGSRHRRLVGRLSLASASSAKGASACSSSPRCGATSPAS